MAINDNKTALKSVRQRNYLARDFDGFRTVLLDYARQYYPDKIQDFSESSLGGLFLDMAAYVGDSMSFYLDHLYGELNPETVVEVSNIEKLLRNAGVQIEGASASTVLLDVYVEIPVLNDGTLRPDPSLIPTVKAGSTFLSDNGVQFTLAEDLQFWKSDPTTGNIIVDPSVQVSNGRRINNVIVSKILKKSGTCSSGSETTETFTLGDFASFRRLPLSQPNVTNIISVTDGLGNTYYEVENLTHDVVYKNVVNTSNISSLVKDNLKVVPAPYRFTKEVSLSDRRTILVMGGGSADTLEDDIIPDPSEFAIPLPYSQSFSRIRVNPQSMLQTSTLGVCATNTVLTVAYRYGGGLDHNVQPNSIRTITNIVTVFPENPLPGKQASVTNSIVVSNPSPAAGGDDALSADQLLALIPTIKSSQERIVTKEDMLARVYTMPSNFGRVFRASITKNPNNPLASRLYIISRANDNQLVNSPDALKLNLKRYLNSYRMISDAVDIVDASIINLELFFQIVVDPSLNKNSLIQSILNDLIEQFNVNNFHIGQPIVISDVVATIFSKPGVIAVDKIKFNNLSGVVKNKQYSSTQFNVQVNTKNQILFPHEGGIFEIKYPDINIVGRAVSNV